MEVLSNLIEAHIVRKIEGEWEFLLLKRSPKEKYPNIWQMVTGSIEKNEIAYKAALREIKEETDLTPIKFWVVPNVNSFYSKEINKIIMVPVFVAMVEKHIVKLSSEHCEYKWLSKDEANKLLAWPGQKLSVNIIYEYLSKENVFLSFNEIALKNE